MNRKKIGWIQIVLSLVVIIFSIFLIVSLILALKYQCSLLEKYNVKKYDELTKLLKSEETISLKKSTTVFIGALVTFLCVFLVSIVFNGLIAYESWKSKNKVIFWLSLGACLAFRILGIISGCLILKSAYKKQKEKHENINQ
ncbi:hypothetical protein [Mycoplasma enhydrae]|uniref:hypothetical protein n=1 Tax=Mycoplasma enhydrae TaxID=2499220 RepID=UPI00197C171B|nr:hypothetical protein [Mycoplasma enhydrae]MBN4089417.1 hypothetical protein [Mycoplasma enhydrae]